MGILGGGHRRRGSSPPHPTPNPAFLGLLSRTVLSIHQGWLGGIRVEKGPGHVQGTREGRSPPQPGAWSGVMPGVPNRSRKARMQGQKSQDLAAASQDDSSSSKARMQQQQQSYSTPEGKRTIPEGAAGPCVPPQLPAGHFGGVLGLFQSQSSSWSSTLLPPSLESTNPYRK